MLMWLTVYNSLVYVIPICLGPLSFNRAHKEITVLTIKYFLAVSSAALELKKVFQLREAFQLY